MNGCGDIEIKEITQKDFESKPKDFRLWLVFSAIQSIAKTCHDRPAECSKKYVKVRHVAFATILILVFLAGLGVIQVTVFLPDLIKTAVASALAAV